MHTLAFGLPALLARPERSEQFRLTGTLTLVGADGSGSAELQAARRRAWNKLSDAGRAQFAWPHPGLPKDVFTPPSATTAAPADAAAATPGNGASAAASTAAAAAGAQQQQQQRPGEGQQQVAEGAPAELEPLPTFCLGVMHVSHVDYIQLFDDLRVVYERGEDGEWGSGVEVNP